MIVPNMKKPERWALIRYLIVVVCVLG